MSTKQSGLILIEPLKKICNNHHFPAANGLHQVQLGEEFHILVANVSKNHVKLISGQWFATAYDHPETLTETDISHGEMLGIVESNKKYRKRDHSANDINLINQHLAGAREAALGEQEEEPITAGTDALGVDE